MSAELTALLGVPPTPGLPLSPQTPIFDLGFGNPYLINNDFRVAYAEDAASNPDGAVPTPTPGVPLAKVKPTFGLRQDFYVNDLRTAWSPNSPTLLCGGDQDPTVYFSVNTETMAAYWSALPAGAVTVLDVNATPCRPVHETPGRLPGKRGCPSRVPPDAPPAAVCPRSPRRKRSSRDTTRRWRRSAPRLRAHSSANFEGTGQ